MTHMHLLPFILTLLAISHMNAIDIGDPAPPLTGVDWIRESKSTGTDHWRLVELWATWCGPCVASIPHLTELQQRHADVLDVIGISNEDRATVEPFVAERGDEIGYAMGVVPEETYAAWKADTAGVPQAYLIDPQGVIRWMGHPLQSADPIAQAIAGTLDYDATKARIDLESALKRAYLSREVEAIQSAANALLAAHPTNFLGLQMLALVASEQDDPSVLGDVIAAINMEAIEATEASGIAFLLLSQEKEAFRLLPHALAFADRAFELYPECPMTLGTRAQACYLLGDLDAAVSLASAAVEKITNPRSKFLFQTKLDYYQIAKELADTPSDLHVEPGVVETRTDPEISSRIAELETALANAVGTSNEKAIEAGFALLAVDPTNMQALGTMFLLAEWTRNPTLLDKALSPIDVNKLTVAAASELAWRLLSQKDESFRVLPQALAFSHYAAAMDPCAGTFKWKAKARYLIGDLDGAIDVQSQAIALARDAERYEPEYLHDLQAVLEYYQSAQSLRPTAIDSK